MPGPQGTSGNGAIIPLASGLPAALATAILGTVATVGLIGFGNMGTALNILGNTIDLTGAAGAIVTLNNPLN